MAYLYIPNSAVGAIIGTKGSHIRNIIRFSGASVKIAPLEDDGRPTEQTERKVTIVGTPEAQWKVRILEAILELFVKNVCNQQNSWVCHPNMLIVQNKLITYPKRSSMRSMGLQTKI